MLEVKADIADPGVSPFLKSRGLLVADAFQVATPAPFRQLFPEQHQPCTLTSAVDGNQCLAGSARQVK